MVECLVQGREFHFISVGELMKERAKSDAEMPVLEDAIVLVDYEHWLYGLKEHYQGIKPNIKGWLEEISTQRNLIRVDFFADFSKPEMAAELGKVRVFSTAVNDTRNANPTYVKDFTDFFILDSLYQVVYRHPNINTIILFTGDAHFAPAVTYLTTFMKKEIIVYGIKGSMSQQLRLAATRYTELPYNSDYLLPYCRAILESMRKTRQIRPDFFFYFRQTTNYVSEQYGLIYQYVQDAMNLLCNEGYLEYGSVTPMEYDEVRNSLEPNWDKIYRDKIITEENSWMRVPSLARAALEHEQNGHDMVFKIPD